MLCVHKTNFKSLFIIAMFLLPITRATSDDVPQEVNQIQTKLLEANEKIAMLTSDQEKIVTTISSLQTSLNSANQEINTLKSKQDQPIETNMESHRMANGHGR